MVRQHQRNADDVMGAATIAPPLRYNGI